MAASWSILFVFYSTLLFVGLGRVISVAPESWHGKARRGGSGVCTQHGEEGEADGTGTGAEEGSEIPTAAPGVSRTSLQIHKDKGICTSHHVWLEKPQGWGMQRRSKWRSYKQTSVNLTLAQEVWYITKFGIKTLQKGHMANEVKETSVCAYKMPRKQDKKQDMQPIIQMLTLSLGPSSCPVVIVQMSLLMGKR